MTTIQERAAATPDEDRWCSACNGTGIIDDLDPTGLAGDTEPETCRDCAGFGWYDADGEPADAPQRRHVGQEIGVVLALFAVLALAGWLVDNFWPGAVALGAGLCIVVWRYRAWTL